MKTMRAQLAKRPLSWPPTVYLVAFLLHPVADHAVCRLPLSGRLRWPAAAVDHGRSDRRYRSADQQRQLQDLHAGKLHRLVEKPLYFELFLKSAGYAALTTLALHRHGLSAGVVVARSHKRYRHLLPLLVILLFWNQFS